MSKNEAIRKILETYRTVAVIGLSRDQQKDSYKVAEYLKSKGYKIVPINPFADEILGEKCYKSLVDMPESLQKTIEIVNIFRPSKDVPSIVDEAVRLRKKHKKPHVIWMQLGIINEEAAKRAAEAGFKIIMDKCMMIEHGRLSADEDLELKRIRVKRMKELMERAVREAASSRETLSSPITVSDADFDQIVQKYPLIVVDFWAPWCGPCRMMAPIIGELAKDYTGKVAFGKLNVDENPQTTARFGIMGIPTFLIIKNGKEVERLVGAVPKQSLETKLRKYVTS